MFGDLGEEETRFQITGTQAPRPCVWKLNFIEVSATCGKSELCAEAQNAGEFNFAAFDIVNPQPAENSPGKSVRQEEV